jgi:hypothetical protein
MGDTLLTSILRALLNALFPAQSNAPARENLPATTSAPARLLLMRHAEKPDDPDNMHLSGEGRERAERLATYIPQTFGKPDFLIAAMQSKHSNRSYETLVPLSKATGLPIDPSFKDTQALDLAGALLSDGAYAGKYGVICWHHGALPGLLAALGAPDGSYPGNWNPDVFNLIFEMTFRDGAEPRVRQIEEDF